MASAQKIYGTVFNAQGDLLPYSSITVKGTTKGTSANDKANYSLNIAPGTYTVICQHLGYGSAEKTVTVTDRTELSFVLPEQKLVLETVVIQNGGEDPAYEIIRTAIRKRNYFGKQVAGFTCNIYGKDLIKLNNLPKKIFGQKIPESDRKEMGLDSTGQGIVYLSESVSKVSVQAPDKFKMEVISSRVSGSDGFGFNFPAFISLYNNNVKVFSEKFNPRGFISPIADGAIGFYKFKLLGTFFENGREINSIRVTPRRKYEPLFSGTINICEDDRSIHSFDLSLTKSAQLEIMDTLRIVQLHVPVDKEIRRVKNQLLHFNFKQFGIDAVGNFLTVYSDYAINPVFPKKYFDNVIIKYDTGVNKKTTAYWDSTRAVPLEKEEEMDYRKKDSTFKTEKDSLNSKRSIDSVNKRQPKVKPFDLITKGIRRTHLTKTHSYSFGIDALLFNSEYNPAEGAVINFRPYFSNFGRRSRTGFRLETNFRYGFNNKHFNPSATLTFSSRTEDSSRKIRRYALAFSGGKRVSWFNKEGAITPLTNTISTLFFGKNYLKTYENYFGSIAWNKRYENGLRLTLSTLYEDRIPLDNTSNFTIFKKDSVFITPNYPVEKMNAQFSPHRAFIAGVTVSFRPGQRYIQFPRFKMSVGSNYPTFTLSYIKGISGIFGSDVNFDKWRFSVNDDKNLKLAGTLKYKFGIGGFLSRKAVFIQDFQHFNGNRTAAASEYVNSFQLASYFANSTVASFYSIGHLEHHFNGLLTNKIPLFRKLNWNFVAGSNAFYVNKDNHYVELFAGLENILKIFRVDAVVSYDNTDRTFSGIRIGAGGLLGSSIRRNSGGGTSVSIGF
ncbi:MAG: DUF5686 and carboxypeptidase regulatory-like domain-containing protein [Ferruginibacter sp.]